MFRCFVEVANTCWKHVKGWTPFQQEPVGAQLVKAADSIGANISEGTGRYGQADSIRFFVIARGSLHETAYWLNRCRDRELLPPDVAETAIRLLDEGGRQLNGFIAYRRKNEPITVKVNVAEYDFEAQACESGLGDWHKEL